MNTDKRIKSVLICENPYPIIFEEKVLYVERIYQINQGLRNAFPNSSNPFEIITRLAEECGELAAEVNHFEGSGVKQKKHGQPNKAKLAKEVQDVIRCALQIATYYKIENQLNQSIETSYQKLKNEGYISE